MNSAIHNTLGDNYRTREELLSLAQQAGLTEAVVDQVPMGINLFLRARRA